MTIRNVARLIALDWGTSFCRAYLVGDGGRVLAERRAPSGIMAVARPSGPATTSDAAIDERDFDRTFESLCADWLEAAPQLPVIACGMIGSNHGWAEAEYRRVPTDLAEADLPLTSVLTNAGPAVHIIPGLIVEAGVPDVMRGEETQILGALGSEATAGALAAAAERVVLLPGTHSKWVRLSGTTVVDFVTCMTGELYGLLTTDSTLSRLATHVTTPDWGAFTRGLDVAASPAGRAGVLHSVFSARTLAMTGQLEPGQVEDYLSGLLIGHETAALAGTWLDGPGTPVLLCGDGGLTQRYERALRRLGVAVELAGTDCAPLGMWQVAVATGLIGTAAAVAAADIAGGAA